MEVILTDKLVHYLQKKKHDAITINLPEARGC
jgi:hypothetical protein